MLPAYALAQIFADRVSESVRKFVERWSIVRKSRIALTSSTNNQLLTAKAAMILERVRRY
jgi:hypothetical protein